ncbi:MAG: hypothetical protein DSY47_06350 [Hydrogenothermus sp.]|nr:MAG: hypothetical protein DSY47_06350 [Hydrogenothermus sp.]
MATLIYQGSLSVFGICNIALPVFTIDRTFIQRTNIKIPLCEFCRHFINSTMPKPYPKTSPFFRTGWTTLNQGGLSR